MTNFSYGPINEIKTDSETVHAFRVTGHIDDDASEALAKYMNAVFDRSEKVNMLLDLTGFTGSDWDSMLDGDVITSRFRALSHVSRYAVIGAPEKASKMINLMDKIIPVEAKAFEATQHEQAWEFVGARPVPEVA
ncbi:STAS/SEC14 domain-containing protein [uncultured Sulfitobacter sp.]|uniref:STAS/SEC14 domain-containing protein n=1 Tax=uncultured Sulfitobacter sp. TaxID=191468 RepID=UPI002609A13E|nr:STAS/SEC14 domain-containing protein [uncultured Sulfitobacter sp.]